MGEGGTCIENPAGTRRGPDWGVVSRQGPGTAVAPVPPPALPRLMTVFLPPGRVAALPDAAPCVCVSSRLHEQRNHEYLCLINSISEANGSFIFYNSCKRLVPIR